MSKLPATYPQLLQPKEFTRLLTNAAKGLNAKHRSKLQEDQFFYLVRNYKSYYAQYNKDSAALAAVAYWAKKVNWDDSELWSIVKAEYAKVLDNPQAKALMQIVYGLADEPGHASVLEQAVLRNLHRYNSYTLSTMARQLNSSVILRKLHESGLLYVTNEIDLLYFLEVATDQDLLELLEQKLCEILKSLNNTQALCNILFNFSSKKNHSLSPNTLQAIEAKILTLPISLKDMNHILNAFNHKTNYGRLTPQFVQDFETLIRRRMVAWPVALTMSYLARAGFHCETLFADLIQRWQAEVEADPTPMVLRDGIVALSQTSFMDDSVLRWAEQWVLHLERGLSRFDIISILRSLVLLQEYDTELWGPLIKRITQVKSSEFTLKDKQTLHHIVCALDIDRPARYLEFLGAFKPLESELSAAFKSQKLSTPSAAEEKLAAILTSLGVVHLQNQMVHNTYEVDFVLVEHGIIVELLGWPYHISQFTHRIDKSTQVKLKHLQTLGWKVMVITSFHNIPRRFKQALELLNASSEPSCVHVLHEALKLHEEF